MADLCLAKSEQRAQVRAELARTSSTWLSVANRSLIAHLEIFLGKQDADILAWKAHFFGEVCLAGLELNPQRELYYPRVVLDNQLDFFKGDDFLADGPKGILQPLPKASTRLIKESARPLICLVPGLAFDREGNRMGRGGGMYDRFLSQIIARKIFIKVGVCWSFQIIDRVYALAHDQKVDYLVSEIGAEKIG